METGCSPFTFTLQLGLNMGKKSFKGCSYNIFFNSVDMTNTKTQKKKRKTQDELRVLTLLFTCALTL